MLIKYFYILKGVSDYINHVSNSMLSYKLSNLLSMLLVDQNWEFCGDIKEFLFELFLMSHLIISLICIAI